MKHIVIKFGGSNLKTPADIDKIYYAIKSYKTPVIVVVSALFGVTDQLIQAINLAKNNKDVVKTIKEKLTERNAQFIDYHIKNKEQKQLITNKIQELIGKIEKYLIGVNYIEEVPDFTYDLVLSYGERMSSILLEQILNTKGINIKSVFPEEINLITDGEFGNASVNIQTSEYNLKLRIKENKNYIIPGFYGISNDRKVTLLGRGGTDYSASSIAACINAQYLDIWKDVNGFMSADPKLVDNAVRITKLTYTEAAELAYFGAKILHPRTVEPLIDKKIPIRIFNIDNAQYDTTPKSVINCEKNINHSVIKSVTSSDDFSILKLTGPAIGIKPGILAHVTTALENEKINIKSVITSQTAINILLSASDIHAAYQSIKKMQLPIVRNIEARNSIAVIAAIGEGINEQPGIAARIFSAVGQKNINVEMIASGASQVATYFIIDKKDKSLAIKTIHEDFFSKQQKNIKYVEA